MAGLVPDMRAGLLGVSAAVSEAVVHRYARD